MGMERDLSEIAFNSTPFDQTTPSLLVIECMPEDAGLKEIGENTAEPA
jgi:hypothetical protein